MKTKSILLMLCLCILVLGASSLLAQDPEVVKGTITVQPEKKQKMTYGMDFERDAAWSWPSLEKSEKTKLVDLIFNQCKVDFARVAINGGAELEEGKIKWEAYDSILEVMGTIKKARPNIKFFASPRPLHVAQKKAPYTCFPLWISEFKPKGKKKKLRPDKFHPDKCAAYFLRYLEFIESKGFKITYMDTKNECDRVVRSGQISEMVKLMKEKLGDKMPIIVAPSSYDYNGATIWIKEAVANKDTDFFQIASSHNTKMRGSMEEFVALANKLGKPAWNTECHKLWRGTNEDAVANTDIVFKHVRAGFCGLSNWLTIGNEKKNFKLVQNIEGKLVVNRPYYIFKKWVNSTGHANYLPSNIGEGLTSNAAFIKGDTMAVWVLNANKDKIVDLTVNANGYQITSDKIKVTSWGPGDYKKGKVAQISPSGKKQFKTKVPADSLSCFLFTVK